MQTKFGIEGDCFDACVASLLELPLESVDYFKGEKTWYADFQNWLAPRGLAYVEVDCGDPNPFYRFPLPVLVIGGGPSPRGVEGGHAVVLELSGWDKKLLHDPHPDSTGLVTIKTIGLLVYRPVDNKKPAPVSAG